MAKTMQKIAKALDLNDISRFGLKSSQDVEQFLDSPAGKVVKALILEDFKLKQDWQEELNFQQVEHYHLYRRILAYFFMGMMYNAAADAKAIQEAEEADQEMLESLKKSSNEYSWVLTPEQKERSQQASEDARAIYEDHLKRAQEQLDAQAHEQALLAEENKKIEQEEKDLESKFAQFDLEINALESELADVSLEKLKETIVLLEKELDIKGTEVSQLISQEQPEAKEKLQALEAKQAKLHIARDLLKIHQGHSQLIDEQGNPVKSLKEAYFIVPVTQKIVVIDNKALVLAANEDLATLSPERKVQAEQQFMRLKPEMMTMQRLLQDQKAKEQAKLQEKALALRTLHDSNLKAQELGKAMVQRAEALCASFGDMGNPVKVTHVFKGSLQQFQCNGVPNPNTDLPKPKP